MPVTPLMLTPSVRRAVMWVNDHLLRPAGSDFDWERPNWDGFDYFDKIDPGEIISLSGRDKPEGYSGDKKVIVYERKVTFHYRGDELVWLTLQGIRHKGRETEWRVTHVRYRVCWPSWCDMMVDRTVLSAQSSLTPS